MKKEKEMMAEWKRKDSMDSMKKHNMKDKMQAERERMAQRTRDKGMDKHE